MTTPARQLYDLINSALTEDPCEFPLKFAYRLAQQASAEYTQMRELLFNMCRTQIEDALKALDYNFEYDNKSWEDDYKAAIDTLNKIGFDGWAVFETVQDELEEEYVEDEDKDE